MPILADHPLSLSAGLASRVVLAAVLTAALGLAVLWALAA